MRGYSLVLAVVGGLVFSQASAASDFTVPVNKDFWEDGVEWSGGIGQVYSYRWVVTGIKGQLAVCGVGKFTNPTGRMQTIGLLRKAEVLVNKKVILSDISFFGRAQNADDLGSAQAVCRWTGVAEPKGQYTIDMNLGGQARF